LRALCLPAARAPAGNYVVLLYKGGQWVRVHVNDEFPVNRNNELLLVRSHGGDELWPMLLEKAYAK